MGVTKDNLIAAIRSNLSLSATVTTRTKHENALIYNTNSVVEAIYKDTVQETQSTGTITTQVESDLDYEVEISKVGRVITMQINVVNTSSDYLSGTIFNITDDAYLADTSQVTNYSIFSSSDLRAQITISATASQSDFDIDAIPPSTSFKGTIIYNAKD